MRLLPFMKAKKGFQFAGGGFESSGGGGSGGGLPDFSTDEFDTGSKWIDGKSIFGKVVTLTRTSSTTAMYEHNAKVNGIFTFSNADRGNDNAYRISGERYQFSNAGANTVVSYWFNESIATETPMFAVIYYTKNS